MVSDQAQAKKHAEKFKEESELNYNRHHIPVTNCCDFLFKNTHLFLFPADMIHQHM